MKNNVEKNGRILPIVAIILNFLFIIVATVWFFTLDEYASDWDVQKYVISFIVTVLFILNLIANKKKHINIFSLYSVFFIFFALFNFGQCFLWAFGIHFENEIGEVPAYGITLSDDSIIKAELLSAIAIISFNTGNLLRKSKSGDSDYEPIESDSRAKILKIIGLVLFIPAYCITMYYAIYKMNLSLQYGYLNASVIADSTTNNLIACLQRLFIPSIFCIIIGYKFDKKVFFLMFALFLLYMVVGIITGDRGEWLYSLCLFILIYHEKINAIKLKQWILIGLIGIIGLTVLGSIRENRNDINTFVSLDANYSLSDNAVIKSIAEMGGSMQVSAVVLQAGENPYPYGNTYFLSLLGIFSDKVVRVFVPDYVDLSTWFSKNYLRLDGWGAGFSSVAEAYMNGGIIGTVFFFIVFGYIISKLMTHNKSYLGYIMAIIVFIGAMRLARSTMSYNLKILFFNLIIIGMLYLIVKSRVGKEIPCENH